MKVMIVAILGLSVPASAGPFERCRAMLQTLEDNFMLKGDQRAEIAKLIAAKSSKDIDQTLELLKRLPPRGLSADVLDYFRSSSPEEVLFVLRRLVTEDIDAYFLKRDGWNNMSARDRVFFNVLVNAKWRSFLSENRLKYTSIIANSLKVSTYFELLYKNKDRKIANTNLETFLLDLSGNYKKLYRFAEISLYFDGLANMQGEIRRRVRDLRALEGGSSGLQRIHARRDRVTLETYLRLTEENGARWRTEGRQVLEKQWDLSRQRFLTGMFPKSPFLANVDRVEYLVASMALPILLHLLSNQSMEWLNPPTEVIFDEEFGFDKNEDNQELAENDKRFIREQLQLGRSLEEILAEIKKSKK